MTKGDSQASQVMFGALRTPSGLCQQSSNCAMGLSCPPNAAIQLLDERMKVRSCWSVNEVVLTLWVVLSPSYTIGWAKYPQHRGRMCPLLLPASSFPCPSLQPACSPGTAGWCRTDVPLGTTLVSAPRMCTLADFSFKKGENSPLRHGCYQQTFVLMTN